MLNLLLDQPLKKYQRVINEINNEYNKISKYSDKDLKEQKNKLKLKINQKRTNLNLILSEAFATTKVAIFRATGMVLFDEQLLAGIILHKRNIAEMKTGEGKTLSALLPAYLHGLSGKGVHIITVNDYLAERDSILAKKIFAYLGLTIGIITQNTEHYARKKEYEYDITYITNSELGFDYLKDNMAVNNNDLVQRGLHYAIIDEVDSILIDEARTPLIISGETSIKSNLYERSKDISSILKKTIHYEVDEKSRSITLTEEGVTLCEETLQIKNLYDVNIPWIKYIINSLKAKELFLKNKDYIIKNNQIVIVDEFTGRIMEGRRWSDGLHQSIEAKENVKIEAENQTLASITYQNLFLLYSKLCGMTGTAKTEEYEFSSIYKMSVIEVPTHKKCIRKDLPDLVYRSEYYKWEAIANECFDMHQIGRPTLIGTTSIEKSELLAKMLKEIGVPYNLLNAKPENISKEAEIIAQAGKKYSITISTNMAGRGTDIILGGNPKQITKLAIKNYLRRKKDNQTIYNNPTEEIENILNIEEIKILKDCYKDTGINNDSTDKFIENITNKDNYNNLYNTYCQLLEKYKIRCKQERNDIINLGGLYVIGTERHESRRIDNQLRGRAGRQGDRGKSRFFLSLQDNLFRIFGGNSIENIMEKLNISETTPIESVILSQSLNSAQKKVEGYFYDIRKKLFEYDEVINNQRKAIYKERKKILNLSFTRDCVIEYGEYTISEMLKEYYKNNKNETILKQIIQLLNITDNFDSNQIKKMRFDEVKNFLCEQFRISYDLKENYLEQLRPGLIRQLEKYYILQQIDKAWQEHINKMNILKEYIGWRSYGQQDPLIEYKNEGFHLFINMITYIRQTVIYLVMRSRLIIEIS
uniref:Protein translocase subunit SecA n=1 Tax=Alsidium seaforthii TaxID=2007182 RepID=A0A1Z1MCR4_9FLOR|nr:preprotein-translocase subunit a [Bryothamnion seaforthii]ARW63887.1 preprotein-translocase subunit a [Bryothamnion seaforthii]